MNYGLITILTSGSHLDATVGAITLTIGKVFNAWVVAKPEEFSEAIADESGMRPLDSADREKAYNTLLKEKWPRVTIAEAYDAIDRMMRECGVKVTVWDEDATSYIDAHAILWTAYPSRRPGLRRLEGDRGNIHMGSIFALAALEEEGPRQHCNVNEPILRATKTNSVTRRVLGRLYPDFIAGAVKEPVSLKGTHVERDFAAEYAARPTELKTQILPVPAPAISLPPAPVPALSLPGAPKLSLPGK